MRVELGEAVNSIDGKALGHIRHVIFDPETNRATAVVLEHGVIFHRDVEAPIDKLAIGPDGATTISVTADEARSLPPFDSARYRAAGGDAAAAAGYGAWPNGMLVPIGIPFPGSLGMTGPVPYYAVPGDVTGPVPMESVESGAPEPAENAGSGPVHPYQTAIEAGSDVFSSDNERVGSVSHVAIDSGSGRPISIVVHRGLLSADDVEVGGDDVLSVDAGCVTLRLTEEEFNNRPPRERREAA